jgi:TRAP-type C4-dicarboxylate transport system permease small subunit
MQDPVRTNSDGIDKILSMVTRLATAAGIVVLLALALLCTLDVLTTRILGQPMAGVIKLSEAGLALILFLGFAITARSRSHVRVDLLVSRLGKTPRRLCHAVAHLFTVFFFALWTWQMGFMTAQSWAIRETARGLLPYPLYPIKFILFLGLLAATFTLFWQLIEFVSKISNFNSGKRKNQTPT